MPTKLPTPAPPQDPQETKEKNANQVAAKKVNDDSNPQQGTGSNKNKVTTNSDAMTDNINTHNTKGEKTKSRVPPNRKDSRKLFVGGLPTNVTKEEFRDFFEQYGALVDSVVMFDRDTHRSRGFGFVTFEDPAVSTSLLNSVENGKPVGRVTMRGKVCELKAAEPREWAPGSSRHRAGSRNKNNGNNRHPSSHCQGTIQPSSTMPNIVPGEFSSVHVPPTGVAPWPYAPALTEMPVPGFVMPEGYYPGVTMAPPELPYEYPGTAVPPVGSALPPIPAHVIPPVQYSPYMGYPQYVVGTPQDAIPGSVPYNQVVMDPAKVMVGPDQIGIPQTNTATAASSISKKDPQTPDQLVSREGEETGQA